MNLEWKKFCPSNYSMRGISFRYYLSDRDQALFIVLLRSQRRFVWKGNGRILNVSDPSDSIYLFLPASRKI